MSQHRIEFGVPSLNRQALLAPGQGKTLSSWELSEWIAREVFPAHSEGFTCFPRAKRVLFQEGRAPSSIYVVSLSDYEAAFHGLPCAHELVEWIESIQETLNVPNHYIGGWQKGTLFYLDVSFLVNGLGQAIAKAWHHHQEAIYHPYSRCSIPVAQPIEGGPGIGSAPPESSWSPGHLVENYVLETQSN